VSQSIIDDSSEADAGCWAQKIQHHLNSISMHIDNDNLNELRLTAGIYYEKL
jgi:hypothetical protein